MSGRLSVCATPIGNMEDITLRVIRTLGEADYVAAEDTRHSAGLLRHYDIKKPMISCHKFNEEARIEKVMGLLEQGLHVALISDAGMPGISDPGAAVIREAIVRGYVVEVLPGANAALCALLLSGFAAERFFFEGFLPVHKSRRREILQQIGEREQPSILYEAPHRMEELLEQMGQALGEERHISISREISKLYEETLRMSVAQAREHFAHTQPRGEFVVVVEGNEVQREVDDETIVRALEQGCAEGLSNKEAVAQAARELGVAKNRVYRLSLERERR
ncbi:MAG: 16S rRNA (cytidine(1402)-2'-O)-methyltransferase [Christensenellales bacterium]|jgi:16S rRNA (cytidine1402-2'-O)-methyltransferase